MSDPDQVAALLEDIQEEFDTTGYVGLYGFTWALRGLRLGLSEEQMFATARDAYEIFRRRTPTTLVWLAWPPHLEEAVVAADDVALEFDINHEGTGSEPFLALIPAAV